jgi:hypothetical protein
MNRRTTLALSATALLCLGVALSGGAAVTSTAVLAQTAEFGTANEAMAMLLKAVAAVKADKAKALDMFAKGEGGFLDRDLYPFCFNLSDGKIHPFANPNAKKYFGQDERTIKDASGKAEGQITEVSYVFPRPGYDQTPVSKVSFVTRAGDLGCGVGYYK